MVSERRGGRAVRMVKMVKIQQSMKQQQIALHYGQRATERGGDLPSQLPFWGKKLCAEFAEVMN
eukprot:4228955-Ditylum_brightwellii.AAC.1